MIAEAQTGDDGIALFEDLEPAADYKFTVAKPEYSTIVLWDIPIPAGRRISVPVTLRRWDSPRICLPWPAITPPSSLTPASAAQNSWPQKGDTVYIAAKLEGFDSPMLEPCAPYSRSRNRVVRPGIHLLGPLFWIVAGDAIRLLVC